MEEDLITKKYRDDEGRLKLGTLVYIETPFINKPGWKCSIEHYAGSHFGSQVYQVSGRLGRFTEKYMTVLESEQSVKIKNIKI